MDKETDGRTSHGFGCAAAAIVVLGLVALGAWWVQDFVKGFDGYGQLEQSGRSGSVADPLPAGATAEYEDGLDVTVSVPGREPDGRTYRFTVTYENGTDQTFRLGGDDVRDAVATVAHEAPLVVRAGRSFMDAANGESVDWSGQDMRVAEAALMPPLGPDETRTVTVLVRPERAGTPVTVEVEPPDASFRETAYFEFSLG
ncbi:hypothetical protein [Streptomyces sp. NPDC090025]|uniref:hypothetical protein n=1 Tax=Streptomyces sp. NPDC090025 TaxID=3365922 RepID=UPI0038364E04